jgi:hypothetical protein
VEIGDALSAFVSNCVPKSAATENRFWSVTLYPSQRMKLRVNAGHQEVFTIHDVGSKGSWLEVRALASRKLDGAKGSGPMYETKSFVHSVELERFRSWLNNERIVAIRELVLRLMRHTTPLNNGSHCPQIVREAFRGEENLSSHP